MFLRFEIAERDARTGQPTGLLTLAYRLLRYGGIAAPIHHELQSHVTWIEKHLPEPTRFSRNRNASHKDTFGISWIRASATDTVARLRAIAAIADDLGYPVDVVRSARPGYVVYEDDHQVVCEPFHGEGR